MPDPLITLSGHTEGPWFLCEHRTYGEYLEVTGIECKQPDGSMAEVMEAGEYIIGGKAADLYLMHAAPDLLAIATELMEIARERGADEKYLAMLWTDRRLAPPPTPERPNE